jgi:hypothetical protein
MSPNSSTADYLVPLTPLSNPNTPPPPPSTVTSPCSDIPESHSTETILEDDDEACTVDVNSQVEAPKYTKNRFKSNLKAGSSLSSTPPSTNTIVNGIDNGITLNPSSLNANINVTVNPNSNAKLSSSSNKKKPVLVGADTRRKDDEEVRC